MMVHAFSLALGFFAASAVNWQAVYHTNREGDYV